MKIYMKGLIESKSLRKLLLIVTFLLILTLTITLIYNYLDNKRKIEFNKEIYRTINFTSNNITEKTLNKYKDNILYIAQDGEDFTIIFKTKETMEQFQKEEAKNFQNTEITITSTQELNENMLNIFQIILYFSYFLLTILIILFSTNYILNIKSNISLYLILGFPKKIVIETLIIFLGLLNIFLNWIVILIGESIYFLLFNSFFAFKNYIISFYIIITAILFLNVIAYIIFKNKNYLHDINNEL